MTKVPVYEHDYVVLSKRCVYGEVGEVVSLTMTANQELSLLESGAVKRAPAKPAPEPEKVEAEDAQPEKVEHESWGHSLWHHNRPTKAVNEEGKSHG